MSDAEKECPCGCHKKPNDIAEECEKRKWKEERIQENSKIPDETPNELKTIISNLEKQLSDEQQILRDYHRRTEIQKELVKTLENAIEILKTIEVE